MRKELPHARPVIRVEDRLRGAPVRDLTVAERDQMADELSRNRNDLASRHLIHPKAWPTRNDYVNDDDRGTVAFDAQMRNYAAHKVVDIPDGSTITACNFTQRTKRTAITGLNLTFVECNLVNNNLHPSWTLVRCNTADRVFEDR